MVGFHGDSVRPQCLHRQGGVAYCFVFRAHFSVLSDQCFRSVFGERVQIERLWTRGAVSVSCFGVSALCFVVHFNDAVVKYDGQRRDVTFKREACGELRPVPPLGKENIWG